MHIRIDSAISIAILFFSNVSPVQGDPGDSPNPIIPSCESSHIEGELLNFCQKQCYFLPAETTAGFPLLEGSMICDVPEGSHLVNARRYFEACRLACVQTGVELGVNNRLYIGQSEIADSERPMSLQAIEYDNEKGTAVTAISQRHTWPYCTGPADCVDAALRTLGFISYCVVKWGGTGLALCAISAKVRLPDGTPASAVAVTVLAYVTQRLAGIRAKLPRYLGGPNRFAGQGFRTGGGTGVSRLVDGGLGGRAVLSDEEIQEQEDEARMWAERVCACNATYTSNGCCFSMDGIVFEDPSLNQGSLADL